jgi:lipid-A-disaccharide synthase
MPKLCLMMVAGERSGDIYGGELAAALRDRLGDIDAFGCGGEAMRRAGIETVADAHQLAMTGVTEVVAGLPRAFRFFHALINEADRRRPRLAVLIDFPSFNMRLAKRLKKRGIRVVYFISPQVWAWKGWRIKQLKATIDKMLCIFDFEVDIYRKAGIPVEYVGHPIVDLVRPHLPREEFFAKAGLDPHIPTVALLPGSRPQEVCFHLPTMLDAASRLALNRQLQFVVPVAPSLDAREVGKMVAECYVGRAAVQAATHATHDALRHCEVAVVASGTATLEAALRERPMVVVYRVAPFSWLFGKLMVNVPFYSMVNILAKKLVVPELMQSDFTSANVAAQVEYLMDHPEARGEMVKEFRALKNRLGPGGAIRRAADAVTSMLQPLETTLKAH